MKRSPLFFAVLVSLACADCGGASPPSAGQASPKALPAAATAKAPTGPAVLTAAAIDERIRAAWKTERVAPAPAVDDARFLRRAYIDIAGVIPPPDKVAAFLADTSPGKRARAIDALLASPRYAAHFTDLWDRTLMGRDVRSRLVDRAAFRGWLRGQFEQNTPYDKLVLSLITAAGQNTEASGAAMPPPAAGVAMPPASSAAMPPAGSAPGMMKAGGGGGDDDDEPASEPASVNGAVNWFIKYADNPADLSGAASRIFLGVQIQCAQCHDHKTEKWTMEDFRGFTACFVTTRVKRLDDQKAPAPQRVEVQDIDRPSAAGPKKRKAALREYANVTPKALDGSDFSESPSRRKALGAWITAPENPWFARAIVNRMWDHFLGRGFVEPVDDLRPGNPGVLPDLMDRIASDFVRGGYDLKRLIRLITATEVYQRAPSAGPAAEGAAAPQAKGAGRLWARFRPEPMGTDELLDSIVAATELTPLLKEMAGDDADAIKARLEKQVTFLFDIDEEVQQGDDFNGTIPQALFLLNGLLVGGGTSAIPGAALSAVLAMPGGDEAKIRALYLRTLSREPTDLELARWVAFLGAPEGAPAPAGEKGQAPAGKGKQKPPKNKASADPLRSLVKGMSAPEDRRGRAYEDLFWALLNSSEFIFNH